MTELQQAVLDDLAVGPATIVEIIMSTGRRKASVRDAVQWLYNRHYIARAVMMDWTALPANRRRNVYMLPEHAKVWGGRIAVCQEDSYSE